MNYQGLPLEESVETRLLNYLESLYYEGKNNSNDTRK